MSDHDKIQRELDKIMIESGVLEKADTRYSMKWVERIVLGILGLFGVAIVMSLIRASGL